MKRTLEHTIKQCMSKSEAPLVLYGPPGVGKSYLLRSFCENEGIRSYIICDLNTDIEFRTGLMKALSDESGLVAYLSEFFLMDESAVRNKLYLILDSIEVLYEKASVMLSGDLPYRLAVTTSRIDYLKLNDSCGKNIVQTLFVPTFSFYEFLEAVSSIEGENYAEILKTQYESKHDLPDMIDDEVRELFHDYLLVGGYPEAIRQYIANRTDISELYRIQEYLYSTTVLRYTKDMPEGVSYTQIMQLLSYIKKYGTENRGAFHPGHIRRGAQLKEYQATLQYLSDNRVFTLINVSNDLYRFEPADCGMLRYILSDYDCFLKMDAGEELPEYIYQNYLYHVVSNQADRVEALRWGRNRYIPYIGKNCIITYRAKDIIDATNNASDIVKGLKNRYFLNPTDKKNQPKNADHNIQYYFLELTQF